MTPSWPNIVRHEKLALLLDLDGTLIPFADTPEAAVLDTEAAGLLDQLADAGVHVVIVSGRPRALLDPLRSRAQRAWWVAEHGAWRHDGTAWISVASPALELDALLRDLRPISETPGVRVERKLASVCVHWRQVSAAHKPEVIERVSLALDEWIEAHPEYERLDVVEALEVRRRTIHKGRAVAWVRERMPGACLMAFGDDATDEDMFCALSDDEAAVTVGTPPSTAADAWLPSVPAVRTFLAWLVAARTTKVDTPPPIEPLPSRSWYPASPLVVVSNRTPPASNGRERPVGGLVSVLEPALAAHRGIWLGWSGHERDARPRLSIDDDGKLARAHFDMPRSWRDHYYAGFCNRALWPLFHGLVERATFDSKAWNCYVEANATFARFAGDVVAPDGTVWVHDYHLLLVARMLRARGMTGKIGLFLHIPFPARDLFETLPWGDEILEAMRSFDLIGFHTEQWAENFATCLRAHGTRHPVSARDIPEVTVLPMTVDAKAFAPSAGSERALDPQLATLQTTLGTRRMVLGVDRLDYSKGILERLLAFERLLERKAAWRGNVNFIQVSVPSRAEVPEYAELRTQVEMLVGRINGRFGEADWVPVRYLYRSYEQDVLAQLYRMADVAMVTPLRDGLNLVAKEFVAAQDPARPGVLLLSRFAGAADELRAAVLTNPYHIDGLADDLELSLCMPLDERRSRYTRLHAALGEVTPEKWASLFLDRLATAGARSRAA